MISFTESDPANARTLTSAQITNFNRDGFLAPLPALSDEETLESRRYFDQLLSTMKSMDDGRNAYAIMGYQNRCKGIWDLAMHPRILDYVEDLLGPDFVCWTTHYFCKIPGDERRVPWHQDATYWPVRPTDTVTAWLAIDDVTADMGPMRFIPGSHRLGKVDWHHAEGDVALQQEIPDAERFGEPVDDVLRAGEISLHTSTLVHGSEPNTSDRRRCGLTLRYIPSSATVKKGAEGTLAGAIPCRGDPGHWKRNSRPLDDDLTPIHSAYRD